jgi:hypothetical protein
MYTEIKGDTMKQSLLTFKENTKNCVWCTWGDVEFFWEIRSNTIVTSGDYQNIYVPDGAKSSLVRKEIIQWLETSFNV